MEERRLSPGVSISLSIRIRSTSHRHNAGAGEQQNSVGGPLFDSLSKTASSVAREASPRPAAVSRRVLDPDLAPIARPLGGDLEAGLGCNAIGPQPQGQSLLTPGSRIAAPPLYRNDSPPFLAHPLARSRSLRSRTSPRGCPFHEGIRPQHWDVIAAGASHEVAPPEILAPHRLEGMHSKRTPPLVNALRCCGTSARCGCVAAGQRRTQAKARLLRRAVAQLWRTGALSSSAPFAGAPASRCV